MTLTRQYGVIDETGLSLRSIARESRRHACWVEVVGGGVISLDASDGVDLLADEDEDEDENDDAARLADEPRQIAAYNREHGPG